MDSRFQQFLSLATERTDVAWSVTGGSPLAGAWGGAEQRQAQGLRAHVPGITRQTAGGVALPPFRAQS